MNLLWRFIVEMTSIPTPVDRIPVFDTISEQRVGEPNHFESADQ